jgi:hypothetical protein
MKKTFIAVFVTLGLIGCSKDDMFIEPIQKTPQSLEIMNSVGIKLETPFVTNEVAMNIKMETAQVVTIKIMDITNKVVSKETMSVKAGDNILKVYTSALPSSAYRIGLFDSKNNQLGITDFNKL